MAFCLWRVISETVPFNSCHAVFFNDSVHPGQYFTPNLNQSNYTRAVLRRMRCRVSSKTILYINTLNQKMNNTTKSIVDF